MYKKDMLGKDFLSVAHMAEILNVSKSMVRARAHQRNVGVIIGSIRIFNQSDIEKMQPSKMGNFRRKS
ncbi:MAG: hypothetical protein V3U02_11320 [Calditrichia bacterium]